MASNRRSGQVGFLNTPHLPPDGRFEMAAADLAGLTNHIVTFLLFRAPTDNAAYKTRISEAVTKGIRQVLDHTPFLAGRLVHKNHTERLHVKVDKDSLVHFDICDLEADEEIPSFEDLRRKLFAPTIFDPAKLSPFSMYHFMEPTGLVKDGAPVNWFQLSYIRGGIIVTLAPHHQVTDARGVDVIIKTLATFVRAELTGVSTSPPAISIDKTWLQERFLNQEEVQAAAKRTFGYAIIGKNDPPNLWFAGEGVTGQLLRFSPESINKLKAECRPDDPERYISTYDCLQALLWQATVRAQLQDPQFSGCKATRCGTAFNQRRFPEVPENYMGFAVEVLTSENMDPHLLISSAGLKTAAYSIRKLILERKLDDFNRDNNLRKTLERDGGKRLDLMFANRTGLDFGGTSWQQMEVDKYDFGFGRCEAVRVPPTPIANFCCFWPYHKEEKATVGILVSHNMFERHWDALKADKEFLKYAEFVE